MRILIDVLKISVHDWGVLLCEKIGGRTHCLLRELLEIRGFKKNILSEHLKT